MSDENNNQTDLTQQQNENKQGVVQNAAQKGKEKILKKVAQSIKSGAAKQSLLAALGPILLWVFVIIVIIIIIIGIAMFLVTMPGMVMDQLKALFKEAGNFLAAFFGADTTQQVENEQIYSTLDYLEEMGWDLKGEGFLTDFVSSTDELDDGVSKDDGVNLDEEVGVLRDDNDNIITAKSDFIFTYIVSDNYVYTIRNGNLATQNNTDNWFESLITGAATAIYKIYNFVYGPVLDFLGITEATGDTWGVGLLAFYYDDGLGVKGTYVNTGSMWNWDSIEIDTESKTLKIARNEFLNNNNAMEFSLDGWTGRYGMPLEFLLSVHKSTMMPDLAYDMATTFDTKINIYLHDIGGQANAAYKTDSGYVNYETLEEATSTFKGKNFFSAIVNWFDDLYDSDAEIAAAKELGIDVGTGEGDCSCEFNTVTLDESGENVVEEKDGKYYYKDGTEYTGATQEITTLTKACDTCRNKLHTIKSYLSENNDYNYKAYQPYIASVENHWYRDVYFVVSGGTKEFVDYDYDYEIMTGERWTLYETDDDGNYVYYVLNDDGTTGEKYEGEVVSGEVEYVKTDESSDTVRIASIGEDGTKVVKKAATIKSTDETTMTDLGWSENNGVWSAYEENSSASSTGYERLYEDDEIEDDDADKEIKEKLYISIATTGNITQTGEGQRTETNSKIKKMFLLNNYFRYDGTDQTAEIIAAMREELYDGNKENYYGAVSDDDAKKELSLDFSDAKYTSGAESGTYKVSDYIGTVTLNQDSLNAFTMLENTHTLDADYIYRDFKELVVELGYFEKEELTDETPKLLQFIVPDIGSNGYPDSSLDKRENEYGTMIHSESDIEVNNRHSLEAVITQAIADAVNNELEGDGTQNTGDSAKGLDSTETATLDSLIGEVKDELGIEDSDSYISLNKVSGTDSANLLSLDEWWESQQEMFDIFKSEGWTYAQDHSCSTFESARSSKHTTDCSLMASWALQRLGALQEGHTFASGLGSGGSLDSSNACAQDLLDAGAEVIVPPSGTSFSSAASSGEIQPGDVLFYDGHVSIYCGEGYEKGGRTYCWDTGSTTGIQCGGPRDTSWETRDIKLIIRLPLGSTSKSENAYEGYEGNEAVVSPVTGILLEYGTYEKVTTTEATDDEGNKITTDDPRVNVDLKYGFPNIYENTSDESGTEEFESQIVSDKVGYAKILVLDAESYQKLESGTSNSWQSDSLVKIDQTTATLEDSEQVTSNRISFREALTGERVNTSDDEDYSEEYDDWNMLDKTVYGYKEFAETYEKYGIAGYVVYIDGFKCELPDPNLSGEEGDDDSGESVASQIPASDSERTLTMDSFKKITETELKDTTETPEDAIESKYEPDEAYKLASEKSTNKLSAEIDLKTQAVSSITVGDLVFIKEGTVIGRTLTDKELLESSDYRNGEYGTYEELRGDLEDSDDDDDDNSDDNLELIGNYLRIIMRDTDGTVVEDVESYMKLDEDEASTKSVSQEYQAWPGDLEALAEVIYHEAGYSYLASLSTKFANDQDEADFEMYCMGYSVVNKLLEQNSQWYGHLYDASRTDMSPLIQVVTNANARWYGYDTSHVTNKMKCYTEKELEYAEFCLTYDCTSVTKPYDTPLGSKASGDGYTKTTQGTVIPRAMCQQGGYGDGASGQSGIILVSYWDHDNDGAFGTGDELWGVDRAMESLLAQDNVTQD